MLESGNNFPLKKDGKKADSIASLLLSPKSKVSEIQVKQSGKTF
jgi:hypothetical protein